MMYPLGAVAVAGVGIVRGSSAVEVVGTCDGICVCDEGLSAAVSNSSSIAESIRAKPKYSPDLLAENIKYTFSAVYE